MTFSLVLTGEPSYVKEHYYYWQKQYRKLVERIHKLIEATALDPHAGLGKPEQFKYVLSGANSAIEFALLIATGHQRFNAT